MAKEETKAAPTMAAAPKTEVLSAEVKDAPAATSLEKPALDLRLTEPGTYRVTMGEHTGEFPARDANDAWAQFCDSIKQWPSPKRSDRVIERIG